MMQTTRKYWHVVLDVRGDPMSVESADVIGLETIIKHAWNPGSKRWIFAVEGDDITSHVAIEIAQNRRRVIIEERCRRDDGRVNRMIQSGCLAAGWMAGVWFGPAFSMWQQIFMGVWFVSVGLVPYLLHRWKR